MVDLIAVKKSGLILVLHEHFQQWLGSPWFASNAIFHWHTVPWGQSFVWCIIPFPVCWLICSVLTMKKKKARQQVGAIFKIYLCNRVLHWFPKALALLIWIKILKTVIRPLNWEDRMGSFIPKTKSYLFIYSDHLKGPGRPYIRRCVQFYTGRTSPLCCTHCFVRILYLGWQH